MDAALPTPKGNSRMVRVTEGRELQAALDGAFGEYQLYADGEMWVDADVLELYRESIKDGVD